VKPEEIKPIEDKEPQTTLLLRTVMDEIVGGKADPSRFTPELRAKLFPEEIKGAGDALKEFGPLKSLELIKRGDEGELRSYKYRATYDGTDIFLSLKLTKDNKIAALDFATD
jgi:hypothetical protein